CDTAGYEHQKAAITDYDGATGVATVASWPAGTPDGTITYELLPMIDCEAFASLLAWEVALRVLVTSRDDTIVRARHHPYAVERKVFKRKYFKMQEVTHGHITFRNLESQA
ncbi:MAG: hypothetical protein GY851_20920, partial [bacterium]|nr:hypothetical protein [bacterium]